MRESSPAEHVSGAGAENGVERARKPDERERSGSWTWKNTVEREQSGAGGRRERCGERAESAAHNPRSNLTIFDCYCKLSHIRILQSISEFRIRTRSSL